MVVACEGEGGRMGEEGRERGREGERERGSEGERERGRDGQYLIIYVHRAICHRFLCSCILRSIDNQRSRMLYDSAHI